MLNRAENVAALGGLVTMNEAFHITPIHLLHEITD